MIEEVKAFWNRQPCNIRHSLLPIGSFPWSKEVTKRKYFVEPHILEFADFSKWDQKKVLEIGCGIGTDTISFLEYGAIVTAIDISEESIRLARQRVSRLFDVQSRVKFWSLNAEDWIPWGPYDLIYSFGVLHHTPNPDYILRRARLEIAPDGELRIMLYAKWSIKNLTRQQPEAQAGCPLAKVYTTKEAKALVESCGFKVTSIRKTHIFPYKIEEYKNYRYVKRWYYRIMPKPIFTFLERLFGWHLLIKAVPK